MVAVTPLLHEIIPHGWARMGHLHPDATIGSSYIEHPEGAAHFRERMWGFMNDHKSPLSMWIPGFLAVGIGWTLHWQGGGWFESSWYREIEAPLDGCWLLDSMIGDNGRTIAHVALTRPRSARPLTADDVQRLDRLRPWLAHAFRPSPLGGSSAENEDPLATAGAPVASGEIILRSGGEVVFQTSGVEFLLN